MNYSVAGFHSSVHFLFPGCPPPRLLSSSGYLNTFKTQPKCLLLLLLRGLGQVPSSVVPLFSCKALSSPSPQLSNQQLLCASLLPEGRGRSLLTFVSQMHGIQQVLNTFSLCNEIKSLDIFVQSLDLSWTNSNGMLQHEK